MRRICLRTPQRRMPSFMRPGAHQSADSDPSPATRSAVAHPFAPASNGSSANWRTFGTGARVTIMTRMRSDAPNRESVPSMALYRGPHPKGLEETTC